MDRMLDASVDLLPNRVKEDLESMVSLIICIGNRLIVAI